MVVSNLHPQFHLSNVQQLVSGLELLSGSRFAANTWGAMKYVRQNESSLLGKADAAIVGKARDLYSEAVQASTEAALQGEAGVVGKRIRQAFAKV